VERISLRGRKPLKNGPPSSRNSKYWHTVCAAPMLLVINVCNVNTHLIILFLFLYNTDNVRVPTMYTKLL